MINMTVFLAGLLACKGHDEKDFTITEKKKQNAIVKQDTSQTEDANITEGDTIMDTLNKIIENIAEVKNLVKIVNSPRDKAEIMFTAKPTPKLPYYWFQAGIDNGGQFLPAYNFLISPKSLKISYYDTSNDTILTLKDWRLRRGFK